MITGGQTHEHRPAEAGRIAYRPDLDGLRAVAIGLVLAAHAGLPAGLGQTGVTLFFVLSGWLITSLLLTEDRIDIRAFYVRRFRRLAPAFLFMLAGVTLLGLAGAWSGQWAQSVAWALSEVGNNATALGVSINEPASHSWSLNIEEQFYLAFPLLLATIQRRAVIAVLLVVAMIGPLARIDPDPVFLSHATHARLDGIAVGCLAALVGWRTGPRLGFAGLCIVVAAGVSGAYWLSLTIATLGAALAVTSVLPLAPLALVGKRAYSLYLWSWPMTILLGPIGGLAGTIVLGEASYRWIEPLLRQRSHKRGVELLELVPIQRAREHREVIERHPA